MTVDQLFPLRREMFVLRCPELMPSTDCIGQRLSWPLMDMAISASVGGWSIGVFRTRKLRPSHAIGKTEPLTCSCMRTSAEWP